MSKSTESSEVLFTLTRKPEQNTSTSKDTSSDTAHQNDTLPQNQTPDSILSIFWKNSKMAAAHYRIRDRQLYVLNQIADVPPQFMVTRAHFKEVNPIHTITLGGSSDDFVKFLIDARLPEDDVTINSDKPRNIPPDMTLLSFKEYTYDSCKNAILNINLPSMPDNATGTERDVYLHSLINFDYHLSLYALGALIKFLGINWTRFATNNEELTFMHINTASMENQVLIEWNTFRGLGVFEILSHEAGFKHGAKSGNREGRSIYKLFSGHCKSQLGESALRNMLLKPTKDLHELNKRLDFIQFAKNPANCQTIELLQDNIKDMRDINIILSKIQHLRASSSNWESLYKTMYHIINIHEFCSKYENELQLFKEFGESITPELYGLVDAINSAIDFENSKKIRTRPVIKFGLDQELDAKKLRRKDIGKHITRAALFAVDQLPPYIDECSIIFVPEMGHLIAIKEWEEDCNPDDLKDLDFKFMFSLNGYLHYKNPMCLELDRRLGDIHAEVIAHENRIIERLSGFVVRHNKCIRDPLQIVAMMDCLIAMAKVAEINNYVRPNLTEDNRHEIVDGRHPLLETVQSNFEPNSFVSGEGYSHVKVLTGPNGSGKSVYLKQVVLIVVMAHFGSYVPAKKASISTVHSIHCRIHTTESAALRLSAFMIDLCEMSHALYNAKSSSLVTIDEFGRGTTGPEGLTLLIGALKKFINQDQFCPHIIVATHLQQISRHLPESPLIEYIKMNSVMRDGQLVFLFQVDKGMSDSYAFELAKAVELDDDIIERAKEIFGCLQNGVPIPAVKYDEGEGRDGNLVLKIPPLDED